MPLLSKGTIARYLRSMKYEMGFSDLFFQKFERRLRNVSECFPGADNGILSFDEMQVKSGVGIKVKNMTLDGLVDYEKSIEVEQDDDGSKNLQDRLADHGLVFMFSSLKALFDQPIANPCLSVRGPRRQRYWLS